MEQANGGNPGHVGHDGGNPGHVGHDGRNGMEHRRAVNGSVMMNGEPVDENGFTATGYFSGDGGETARYPQVGDRFYSGRPPKADVDAQQPVTFAEFEKRVNAELASKHSDPRDGSRDEINHPLHYTYSKHEPIDVIEAWGLGFNTGNVLKYLCRADRKGELLENLKKAAFYLAREVQLVTKLEEDGRGVGENPPIDCGTFKAQEPVARWKPVASPNNAVVIQGTGDMVAITEHREPHLNGVYKRFTTVHDALGITPEHAAAARKEYGDGEDDDKELYKAKQAAENAWFGCDCSYCVAAAEVDQDPELVWQTQAKCEKHRELQRIKARVKVHERKVEDELERQAEAKDFAAACSADDTNVLSDQFADYAKKPEPELDLVQRQQDIEENKEPNAATSAALEEIAKYMARRSKDASPLIVIDPDEPPTDDTKRMVNKWLYNTEDTLIVIDDIIGNVERTPEKREALRRWYRDQVEDKRRQAQHQVGDRAVWNGDKWMPIFESKAPASSAGTAPETSPSAAGNSDAKIQTVPSAAEMKSEFAICEYDLFRGAWVPVKAEPPVEDPSLSLSNKQYNTELERRRRNYREASYAAELEKRVADIGPGDGTR